MRRPPPPSYGGEPFPSYRPTQFPLASSALSPLYDWPEACVTLADCNRGVRMGAPTAPRLSTQPMTDRSDNYHGHEDNNRSLPECSLSEAGWPVTYLTRTPKVEARGRRIYWHRLVLPDTVSICNGVTLRVRPTGHR